MALPTRWNPLRQISRFDPIGDLEDVFRSLGARSLPRDLENVLEMRMDITEDDKAYKVAVDVPGVRKEHIDVSIQGNQVQISAEVKREQHQDQERQVYSERYEGRAFRSFSLPAEVDSESAKAEYDGGVLKLTLPKKTGGGSKRLPIN
jgi:HSP20 family protein